MCIARTDLTDNLDRVEFRNMREYYLFFRVSNLEERNHLHGKA